MLFKSFLTKFRQSNFYYPVLIAILITFAYGLLSAWQGYYWDDWPFAWLNHFFGPVEYIAAFRPFRPFLGYIFYSTTLFFGSNPITWQIIGLVIRFLMSILFWSLLKMVWPAQKSEIIWIVLLFTVYPGYLQQWVSLTHVNQELIPLIWMFSSFLLTAYALRKPKNKVYLTLTALFLQVLGLFSTEYFFGIEIIRLFFMIVIISETQTNFLERLRKSFINWLPYLFIWITNAVWLYEYHQSSTYNSYEINIFQKIITSPNLIINEIIGTFTNSAYAAWANAFQIFSYFDGTAAQLYSVLIFIISGIIVYFYMLSVDELNSIHQNNNDRWGLQAAIIGILAIFAGRLPSFAAGLPLKLEFDFDRLMISIMPGASMFIVGASSMILKNGRRKILILSILIGICTAYQFNISNSFRRDWNNQKTFFWQLAWRIPAMEKNTVLLTYELPIKYASDFQMTAPINWIYSTSINIHELPYALLYIKSRIGSQSLPSLQPGIPIKLQYRTTEFTSNTSDSIVIYKQADGCLRVLDPVYGNSETVPGVNYYLTDSIRLSNLNKIKFDQPQPVLDKIPFGDEPVHDWCYFYEKSELARQQSHWDEIIKLHKQAIKEGLTILNPVENLPFIEAYANKGDLNTAMNLTEQTVIYQKELCPAINTLWSRFFHNGFEFGALNQGILSQIARINKIFSSKSYLPAADRILSCQN